MASVAAPAPKVLKVKIQTSLYKRLHIARMLTGRPIAAIVQAALDDYLRQQKAKPLVEAAVEAHAQA